MCSLVTSVIRSVMCHISIVLYIKLLWQTHCVSSVFQHQFDFFTPLMCPDVTLLRNTLRVAVGRLHITIDSRAFPLVSLWFCFDHFPNKRMTSFRIPLINLLGLYAIFSERHSGCCLDAGEFDSFLFSHLPFFFF